jgi:hypothetical protein
MKQYRIDVFEPRMGQPEAVLKHRRDIYAADEQTAIEQAKQMYRKFAADAQLERFVLYNGEQIVYEHVGRLE